MKKVLAALLLSTSLAHADNVGGYDAGTPFIPVLTTTSHTSGQSLGGLQTVSVFRQTGVPSHIFDNIQITSIGGATTSLTFYVYDTKPTGTCKDGVAFVEANSDIPLRAMAPFVLTPAVVGVGTTSATAQLTQVVSIRNGDQPATPNIYICIVGGGTATPASVSDLVGKISAAQD